MTEYTTWKDENERINASIINEVRNKSIKELEEQGVIEGLIEYLKESHKKDIQEGIEQGMKEGTLNTKKEMIINMYQENIPIEVISKCTNLSINEIHQFIDKKQY